MYKYTNYLHELESENIPIFDFPFELGGQYKKVFIRNFYDKYYYRQIGCENIRMFKDWVRSKTMLNLPKYTKMYESVNIFSNPFVNTIFYGEDNETKASRFKRFNTSNNEFLSDEREGVANYNNNLSGSSFVGYELDKNIVEGVDKTKSIAKDKADTVDNYNNTELFTDTPQSKVLIKKEKEGHCEQVWNEGYLTTATNTSRGIKNTNKRVTGTGATTYKDTRESAERGNNTITKNNEITKGVSNRDNKTHTNSLANSEKVGVKADEFSRVRMQSGLQGLTLAEVVMQWRESFIKVDEMFLNEYNELFLNIY